MAQSLVYGIDVGTTKIVALAGRVDPRRGWVEVLSMGEAPSYGLKRGVVVDRQAAAEFEAVPAIDPQLLAHLCIERGKLRVAGGARQLAQRSSKP